MHFCDFAMTNTVKKWSLLIVLSLIWGSSYILIKKGLIGLTPLQLGSFRIIFTTLILFLAGRSHLKKIPLVAWKWIVLTGYFGTFFPSYLFAFAETKIDSSVAAVLNGMTPLFTILLGVAAFAIRMKIKQLIGVLIGFGGTLILVSNQFSIQSGSDANYAFLVVGAASCYALNVNIIKYRLEGVSALGIALGNFVVIIPFALLILGFSDFQWRTVQQAPLVLESLGFIFVLALFGTALAKVMFNQLVAISSPVFSVSINYLLPIVAVGWGILDGEQFSALQWSGCGMILTGVYLVTESKK